MKLVPLLLFILLTQPSIAAPATDPLDDTYYVQALVDLRFIIPDGVFRVSETIIVKGNVIGSASTELVAIKPIKMFVVSGDVQFRNLKIDGSLCRTVITNAGKVTSFRCENVSVTGSLPTTQFLIDLNGDCSDIVIDNCQLKTAYHPIRLRDKINRARVSNCTITDWRNQGILIRSGDDVGPQFVTIEANHLSNPATGKGSPRQMICAYGDPETPASNILGLKVINNVCIGSGEPYDPTSETTKASGDQIAIHRCIDFSIVGNVSNNGGEIGISVTQWNYKGLVANNLVTGNDSHGMQISSLGKRSTDILVIGNRCIDNAIKNDGNADVMAGLYIQDGARIVLQDNLIRDTRIPRKHKYGILVGSSSDVRGGGNLIEFADPKGAKLLAIFNSKGVEIE